ncbi:hypothetical protein THMIRHAS_08410 [Thiosulfatimonas sediminis]|uniref:H repeat-associated protein N-terminal domain-containing protein n=1 Tax=Thiosulfatimonas sediminis TaxID=2675054 RepID=A0A6F8PTY3_9GAMM|nr:hypothetical protein THMIRHAS_08410 [Thiosulfatimonas sediminis]
MATCAMLCGADDWESIALFAQTREKWFKRTLRPAGGVPSHDTFNRLFAVLDPQVYRDRFSLWVQELILSTPLIGVVAIDGKTLRASDFSKQQAIHMVNA